MDFSTIVYTGGVVTWVHLVECPWYFFLK